MAPTARVMDVFTIIEKHEPDRSFWVKVGVCFTNRDGSLNVSLDALPVNGKLHIRPRTSGAGTAGETRGQANNHQERRKE